MRVGSSAGDASFEDGGWFGTPVVEASRLCTAAEGGWNDGVVMGSVARQRSGRRGQKEVEPFPAGRLGGATLPAGHTPTSFVGCLNATRQVGPTGHEHPDDDERRERGETFSRTQNQRRGERGAENACLEPAQLAGKTPTEPSVLSALESGNGLCQPRTHAPPATSIASRPAPTVATRNAIFFMMSVLSHLQMPSP